MRWARAQDAGEVVTLPLGEGGSGSGCGGSGGAFDLSAAAPLERELHAGDAEECLSDLR
jgi:hypothetical protein